GYEQVSLVRNPGEFSRRGSILDIFPPFPGEAVPVGPTATKLTDNCPVRLDFFGDLVESLRFFDPISQRSLQELAEFTILPVSDILFPAAGKDFLATPAATIRRLGKEQNWDRDKLETLADRLAMGLRFPGIEFLLPLFYPETATPLDYLPPETLLVMADPAGITATVALAWERITANQAEASAHREPALPPARIFLSGSELARQLDRFALLQLHDFPADAPTEAELPAEEKPFTLVKPTPAADVYTITCGNHTLLRQELELQRRKSGLLAPLAERINHWLIDGDRVAIACRSSRHAEQLGEFLGQHGLITQPAEPPLATAKTTAVVSLYSTPVSAGFDLPAEGLHLLSETELFGEKRLSRRKVQGPPPGEPITFEELKGGDIVVH
ncbi:MAG TPA: transcription-repair coupling factor, partial [Desulfurivibrionaceae bacterium]|nr:transcription-repair coupling factor [Desulfurivibrionaceae bacterium]